MNLNKQQEQKLMEAYNAYWDNYIKGDVHAMHALLDDNYTQVGSAEGEVFLTKKDAVQFLYDTINQVAGKIEMRNRITKLDQQENIVLIQEHCDLYALAGNQWIFHSKFRASTLMHETKDGWKIIHQHSSFPGITAQEEKNIAIEKIAAENIQLRDAVKHRTVELEYKNRQLEIEAALEKVRSRTMGMHHSPELEYVIEETTNQLQQLGFQIDSANFSINLDIHKDPDMHLWLGVPGTKGYFKRIVIPYFDHPMFTRTYEAIDNGEELITDTFTQDEKNRFYDHIYERTALSEIPQGRRNYVLAGEAMTRSTVFSKSSALTVIKYSSKPIRTKRMKY